jgi:hypothetical protein
MGQISATIIHAHGPQLYPKCITNNQTIATAAQPAAFSVFHWFWSLATITAMMMWQVAIPIAPIVRMGLRPSLSMYSTDGMVARNMAIPTTPVARREVVLEERPREVKMVGA